MFPETEKRVDRLEVALERFITQTTAQMGDDGMQALNLKEAALPLFWREQ